MNKKIEKKVTEITTTSKIAKIAVVENATKVEKTTLSNVELYALINKCGCIAMSNAKSNNCIYNQFGTHSRVLQYNSKRANYRYQLLLTDDDAKLFQAWYKSLPDDRKKSYDATPSRLSISESPRTVAFKCTTISALIDFINEVMKPQSVNLLPTM
jgi:hypothetical protein